MNVAVQEHEGVSVVRDDLYPGGSKARFLPALFHGCEEVVYASPAEGGTQTAIAHVARKLGKRATIFVAKRKQPHNRTLEAKAAGASVRQVPNGYLSVVQARARKYAKLTGARLLPFGLDVPAAREQLAAAARSTGLVPDEVWCAGGSGTLSRALRAAWPDARVCVVQVGRRLREEDAPGCEVYTVSVAFKQEEKRKPPFPSCPHYDAKAWFVCKGNRGSGRVVFWNVTGPADPGRVFD